MESRNRGFSIVEVVLSIAIMSVTIVMVCAMYTFMMRVSQKGFNVSVGTNVADRLMNELASQKGSKLNTLLIENHLSGFRACGNELVGDSPYYYILEVKPLPNPYSSRNIVRVDLVVFWWTDNTFDAELAKGLSMNSISNFLSEVQNRTKKESIGFLYRRFTRLVMISEN